MSKRITTEDFKKTIFELTGDEFELLSEYKTAKTKVLMRHKKCGNEFEIKPDNFKCGNRCPFCAGKRHNIQEAVKKANEIGLTLLETEYKGVFDKMKCTCKIHPEEGILYTTMTALNQGHNCCDKCRYDKIRIAETRHTTIDKLREEFDERNLILTSTEYLNCKTPLTYICKKHIEDGEQTVTYDAFKNQNKFCCTSCAKEHISDLHMTPMDEIKKIVEEHNFEFIDLSMRGRRTMIHCICKNHRDKGIQIKSLSGIKRDLGCIYCAGVAKFTQEEFQEKVWQNDKNIEVVSEYTGNKNKVDCHCKACGYEWSSIASNLMYGGGCPNCSGSKGEIKIRDFLDDLNLSYEREFSFDDLWGDCDRQLRFDFAVFNEDDSIKCLIEYDGIQHFKPINFWGNEYSHTQLRFETLQRYDKRKNNYCKKNGIKLIRIPYTEFENIEEILEKQIA